MRRAFLPLALTAEQGAGHFKITSARLQETMEQRGEAREDFLEEVAPALSLKA